MATTTSDSTSSAGTATEVQPEAPIHHPLEEERGGWLRETPFWAVSALLHAVLFFVLVNIAIGTPERREKVEIICKFPLPPSPTRDPEAERWIERLPRVDNQILHEKLVVTHRPVEVQADIPEGTDLDKLADLSNAASLEPVIGLEGGPGDFGDRLGKGTLVQDGGGPATEDAVLAALEWLLRHQHPDGSWRARDFTARCETTCANREPARRGDGRGFVEHDVGVTALAVLAFAGYGQTHQDGTEQRYVAALKRAVRWLKSVQVRSGDPNEHGRFGRGGHEQWIYDHAIATMALGELLAMSNDVLGLRRTATDAVRLCLRARNDGFGWRYGIKPGQNDTSVTGWMVLALKTAKNVRPIDVPRDDIDEALSGALRWVDRATSSATGKTGYMTPGDEGSRLAGKYPEPYPYSKDLSCMTAVGVLSRLFAGEGRSTPIIKRGVDILMRELPSWREEEGQRLSTVNLYYWYYGSYAMFQFGGQRWEKWNRAMLDALLDTQRRGGDEDGSWDPVGEWGVAGGRVYATALGAMTLEVYYRYERARGR